MPKLDTSSKPLIDLKALAAFCDIAEHGSLTRAAAATGVAQSALSRRLSALEARLGGRLFHRTGRGTVPTTMGAQLALRARAILSELHALEELAHGESARPAGTVELGIVPAMSRPLVSELYTRLRHDYPRIRLRAHESYSGQVEDWLASGRIDLGIFNRYGRGRVQSAEPLLRADIALVAHVRHRLRGGEIAFRQLETLPLVLPPRPNALVSSVIDIAHRQGVALEIALEANSPSLIRDAVQHAGLCTLLPAHLAKRDYDSADFTVFPVVKPAIRQATWFAMTAQRPATLAARCVARLIREMTPGGK